VVRDAAAIKREFIRDQSCPGSSTDTRKLRTKRPGQLILEPGFRTAAILPRRRAAESNDCGGHRVKKLCAPVPRIDR